MSLPVFGSFSENGEKNQNFILLRPVLDTVEELSSSSVTLLFFRYPSFLFWGPFPNIYHRFLVMFLSFLLSVAYRPVITEFWHIKVTLSHPEVFKLFFFHKTYQTVVCFSKFCSLRSANPIDTVQGGKYEGATDTKAILFLKIIFCSKIHIPWNLSF